MNHSDKFDLVKNNYDKGLWVIKRVRDAVGRWITKEEFEEITGQKYQ